MSNQVTLSLSPETWQQAQRMAQLTNRGVSELLADALSLVFAPVKKEATPSHSVEQLTDKQVLALTQLELPPAQDKRLSKLLLSQQAGTLSETQRHELLALMQTYQEGLLRKAQALRVAVQRGLMSPLEP